MAAGAKGGGAGAFAGAARGIDAFTPGPGILLCHHAPATLKTAQ